MVVAKERVTLDIEVSAELRERLDAVAASKGVAPRVYCAAAVEEALDRDARGGRRPAHLPRSRGTHALVEARDIQGRETARESSEKSARRGRSALTKPPLPAKAGIQAAGDAAPSLRSAPSFPRKREPTGLKLGAY